MKAPANAGAFFICAGGELALSSPAVEALLQEGLSLHRQSRLEEARERYAGVLSLAPGHARALHLLAILALQSRQIEAAVPLLRQSLSADAANMAAYDDLANALLTLKRYPEAIELIDHSLRLFPAQANFHAHRGNAFYESMRLEEAIGSYEKALALDPSFVGGYYNRAMALFDLRRFEAAIDGFEQVIARSPQHVRAFNYRGEALYDLGRPSEAAQSFRQAIALQPSYADAHNNLGNALMQLEEPSAALQSFKRATELMPAWPDAHNNLGNAHFRLDHFAAALASYDAALALDPHYPGVHLNRGLVLGEMGRHQEAAASIDRAIALRPDLPWARGEKLLQRMHACDWRDYGSELHDLESRTAAGERVATPFVMLALSGSAPLQLQAATQYMAAEVRPRTAAVHSRPSADKLSIGYFSADFREHPVARLGAQLFESHDRSRFDVTAFSFGPATEDAMHKRLQRAFDRFLDVKERSADAIAELARQLGIDIAVDLTGLTKRCRPQIFASRAAPLQVGYLGYLGSLGAPFMDYVFADAILIPDELRSNYSESVVRLPSYQPNDSARPSAESSFTRMQLNLPENAFVYGSFNANYKITPGMFDVWMRILGRVPDSVLFLYAESDGTAEQLKRAAMQRGMAEHRLVFGGRLSETDYLARYRCVDLFLDTLPYNAGTTASDALWAGLPVLTCAGQTLTGRMAASLLSALQLSELITTDLTAYENLAVALATEPMRLAAINRKLSKRKESLLFDSARHTRSIEAAFEKMLERLRQGLPPADFAIAAD